MDESVWNYDKFALISALPFRSYLPFSQILVALSPLIALGFILFSAFESPEAEALKRKKKGFQLEGHGE